MTNLQKSIQEAKAVEAAQESIYDAMKKAGVESINTCLLKYHHILEAAIEQWTEMGLEFTSTSNQTQVDFKFPQGRIEIGYIDQELHC